MGSSHSAGGGSRGGVTHASGRATYGYGGSRGGYYGGRHGGYYGGYYGRYYGYGHYGYYPYSYWGWGWPWYYGGYSYARPYYYPVQTVRNATAPAVIQTAVKPKKAELFLDGQPIGQARDYSGSWDVLYVKPGRHEIEFRKDGLMTLHYAVDVQAGAYYAFDEKMQKGEGLDPRSVLEFPERPVARSSAPAQVRPPEKLPEFEADVRTQPSVDSNLRRGLLRLDVSPPDAAVYLDGEFLAQADELRRLHGALPVAAGNHIVEVVRPGYVSERQQVEVSDGDVAQVAIRLARPEESP